MTSVQTDPNLVEDREDDEEEENVHHQEQASKRRHSKPVGAAVSKSSYAVSASRLSGTITSDNERSGRER